MIRAIACLLVFSGYALSAAAQELQLNVIQETLSLNKSDIVSAEAISWNGQHAVRIKLGPDAAKRFGEITSRHVGKPMQIVIGDRILTTPVIKQAIMRGELVISGGYTIQQAEDLAKRLK
jgi:preprotein translocase subunit SecD